MENKQYFDTLQVYRGIAALCVVVHHTYASFAHFNRLDFPVMEFAAKIGKFGVDFFFVLSGFIITYTTYKYRGSRTYLKRYFSARILKIYIPYLPISIGLLLLYHFIPSFSESNRSVSLLTSLTLLPDGNPALSVAWTLVFEMFFYIVYSLNFLSVKFWHIFLLSWIVGIVAFNALHLHTGIPLLKNFFNLYNLEFIFGVCIAYIIKKNLKPSFLIVFSLSFGLLAVFMFMKYFNISLFPFSQNLIFAASAGLFVILGVYYWNRPLKSSGVWMLLGNSSYSLYLLHNPLQSFFVRIVPKSLSQISIFFEFSVVIIIIIIFAYVYYWIFEKTLIPILKKKTDIYIA